MEDEMKERFEDWRGREAVPEKHGGIRAATIACVVEMLENLVFLANANNFVTYFMKSMHYGSARSANMVTNFMGTSFLLTLFGGFVADSFLTRFTSFVLFCSLEILGLILLTVQAHSPKLQPPPEKTPSALQSAFLFTGLYAMAVGVGGVKASLPSHGGDQLDNRNQRLVSGFFNWYFFSLCSGGFFAVTVMVWIEENKGWNWSFNISLAILAFALCIFSSGFPLYRFKRPSGSPLTRIVRVIASATRNRKGSAIDAEMAKDRNSTVKNIHQDKFKFLDKALLEEKITAVEVEETRTFLALLPIFGSTIMMNCCLAQLTTFSVQQGVIMDRKLGRSFEIPVPSLTIIPLSVMLSSIPLYEFFRGRHGNSLASSFFQPLKRIGLGLALSSISMAVAAAVEAKRRSEAVHRNEPISVFWLGFQYLFLGVADMLALGGMLEFFYREAPDRMRSISTALSWSSTAMGFFLSSVLVELTNAVTGGWLGGKDLNKARLDLFYVVLSVLNTLNLFNYVFWAKRY
ncbi:PREDICTED: protein NRT1/ PTR FAMILY 4.2-like [Tarenaya hassleriana]|uniref:protein NRT1/ PTR FAMILY 4.2-like n=1 Tax=Tarenaya hassleriana TaxID=28532 RepID=UPI00053C5445|nr:PREDICTED: protein NRT1/ PTR FAMILY 4.2-like [Tarenaya hassleriana]XP_010532921.1 PREDICTED: protein NRT1/ PTR FAMILY 4.2-like [Tarenaya hassleriana]